MKIIIEGYLGRVELPLDFDIDPDRFEVQLKTKALKALEEYRILEWRDFEKRMRVIQCSL
jgi:hypothetical protein